MEMLADFGIGTFTTGIFCTWFGVADGTTASQLAAMMLVFVIALIMLERYRVSLLILV